MYWANVNENSIEISGKGTLVVGNANANLVIFSFSSEWSFLRRVAVFRNSINMVAVDIPSSLTVKVPWECCEEIGDTVYIGAYGIDQSGNVRRPTTWVTLGKIVDGVDMDGAGHSEPTKSIFTRILDKMEDLGKDVEIITMDISEMSVAIENLEDTATDHRSMIDDVATQTEYYSHHPNLKNRDEPNQHPVSSVEGLEESLGEDMTPEGLLELLGG